MRHFVGPISKRSQTVLVDLPDELLGLVFQQLDGRVRTSLERVNRRFKSAVISHGWKNATDLELSFGKRMTRRDGGECLLVLKWNESTMLRERVYHDDICHAIKWVLDRALVKNLTVFGESPHIQRQVAASVINQLAGKLKLRYI